MMPESTLALREFVIGFCRVHHESNQQARVLLVSSFATCFGLMSPEDRVRTVEAILTIAKDINVEKFEDGQDFLAFLTEKAIDHKEEIKRLESDD